MNTEMIKDIITTIVDEARAFKSTVMWMNVAAIIVAIITIHPTFTNLVIGVIIFNTATILAVVLMIALCIAFDTHSVKS